ncbi:MAG: GDP-mannose 4,6-dehydratase [Agriterribacter sp.]
MKALIFGANGQDGFYLADLLNRNNIDVISSSRKAGNVIGDVSDIAFVKNIIEQNKPGYIFHLAANSTTRHDALYDNHLSIATGTLNVLESVKLYSPYSKVFISGSGLQFKNESLPIKETDPFEARDAYSISRIQSVYAARYYRRLGIQAYVGYFFNHDSPRRSPRHVSKMIAAAVKNIEHGSKEIIEIGDLTVKKEWGYAGDIVEAAWTLVQQNDVVEAVLGTGEGYSIQDYIEVCFKLIKRDWQESVKPKPGFVAEYSQLVSNPETIFSLGWKPKTSFNDLAIMMLTNEQKHKSI